MIRLVTVLLIHVSMDTNEVSANCKKFPDGFLFGTSTSAYQTEGAYKTDGKGESIWDNYTHRYPSPVDDGSNGDVACNSYYLFPQDVQLIKNIGFQIYRFSISWTRILPNGDLSYINQAGIRHYHRVIDTLLANGIQPMITIYHWDLPQKLQDKGGWLNGDIVDYITDYAGILFEEYGHKVKWWVTINEPYLIVWGYSTKGEAPGLNLSSPGDYDVGHNILLAHAAMYRLYDTKYRPCQNGKISIVMNSEYAMAADPDCKADRDAAERAMQFQLGWFAHPIYSDEGGYPPLMEKIVNENSRLEGRQSSRLPQFTEEEKESLKGAFDFFGLNHYTSFLCKPGNPQANENTYTNQDKHVIEFADPKWPSSALPWLNVVPSGFLQLLVWIKNRYNNPMVFVTENGYADHGKINDVERVSYYKKYLHAMWNAINDYDCNVIGFATWSILDDFEWSTGYVPRFGLTHVNFQTGDRKRTPKYSTYFWKDLMKSRCLKL